MIKMCTYCGAEIQTRTAANVSTTFCAQPFEHYPKNCLQQQVIDGENFEDNICLHEQVINGEYAEEEEDEETENVSPLTFKDTNPKDAVGVAKWRQYSTVPTTIIWELGVAMLEGARKYGRHNYRVAGVRASVYLDAAKGHMDQWWEGEDVDEESGLSHITKAMASLAVLRDAMIQNKFVDDRPPKTDLVKFRADMQAAVDNIFHRYPKAVPAFLEGDQNDDT